MLVNSDGYWTRGSDYYLYLDERGRFHIIPGDTNETFSSEGGRGGRRGGPVPAFGAPATGGFPPPSDVIIGRGFGGPGGGGPALDLLVGLDDPTKPLRSKLLAVPSFRERYLAYCRDIALSQLDWARIGAAAGRYHQLIRAFVETDTRKLISDEQFAGSLDELRAWVEARRTYVLNYGRQ